MLSDEDSLSDLGARPDWAVLVGGLITGHIELKAPGKGADTSRYSGHDARQWAALSALPNLLYTDGNEWALYRFGERVGPIAKCDGDVRADGASLAPADAALELVLTDFLRWEPSPPRSAKQLASVCAHLCRLLRAEVEGALDADTQPLRSLAEDWRYLLFPEATDEMFADGYAQTVTFALLLARAEGIDFVDRSIHEVAGLLGSSNSLMGKALDVLTDPSLFSKLATSLTTLHRLVSVVDWSEIESRQGHNAKEIEGEWLFFYEHFLAIYDPELRKRTGSYYTPNGVVAAMVHLADDVLRTRLGRSEGFASDNVVTVDPAVGTGTFLLHIIDLVAERVASEEGEGAKPGRMEQLSTRTIGFEKQTGPYAVAELRALAALRRHGTDPTSTKVRLYLADTLDDPFVAESHIPAVYGPIAQSRRAANKVKAEERVIVVIGNPPYKEQAKNQGHWVENGNPGASVPPILDQFIPADDIRVPGNHLRHLRNLYVYFWRWALWKALEVHDDSPSGVIALITSSAWLRSPGFVGVRDYMRAQCDEVYVLDLGGSNRGGRRDENVFDIQTPVAIVLAVRSGSPSVSAAKIRVSRIHGTREEKLAILADINGLASVDWASLEGERGSPFLPLGSDEWTKHPTLTEVLPWGVTAMVTNRTWVYSPDSSTLESRWIRLVTETDAESRRELFKESFHRMVDTKLTSGLPGYPAPSRPIADEDGPPPSPVRVGFRSFDRQWVIPDIRLIHGPSPNLWRVRSDRQVYLTYKHNDPISSGPAVVCTGYVPDVDHYHGRGGRAVPLWRDRAATEANVLPDLASLLTEMHARTREPADVFAYVVGITGHQSYVDRFYEDLAEGDLRVPITADADLFDAVVDVGKRLVWLQTFGERFVDAEAGRPAGPPKLPDRERPLVLAGSGIPTTPDGYPETIAWEPDPNDATTGTLLVGTGRIAPVPEAVWSYDISGMPVVAHWFGYRKMEPAGKRSSELDDIVPNAWPSHYTTELLSLLNVLGLILRDEVDHATLLDEVVEAPTISRHRLTERGLLPVPTAATNAPPIITSDPQLFD